jgi:hypothetical protein
MLQSMIGGVRVNRDKRCARLHDSIDRCGRFHAWRHADGNTVTLFDAQIGQQRRESACIAMKL